VTPRRVRTHHKLFLSYTLLVAGVVVILVLGVDRALREPLVEQAKVDLLRELALGREIYDAATGADPDSVARHLSGVVGHRVTIIAADGVVLGESDVPPAALDQLDNHAGREEVRQARATGTGTAVRWSVSVNADLLYAAALTRRGEVVRFAVGIEQIDRAVARVRAQILQVGAGALLLAVAFSLAFSFAATRRLRHMRRVALAMARGDLSARVRPVQRDELGELGGSLDTLAAELQRRLGQLEEEREEMTALIDSMAEGVLAVGPDGAVRRANPAARSIFELSGEARGMRPEAIARRKPFLDLIQTAVSGAPVPATEISHDGKELLATAQPLPSGGAVLVFLDISELRRLEGVRRDFVANASHELKTPLTAIRGYSETLLDDDIDPELRRRFTRTIHDHATRLQHILDDLLDLSRIESGGWTLEPARVSIQPSARDAWSPLESTAVDRGVSLEIRAAEGADTVTADPDALRQVFTNLLSNALRYSPDHAIIEVRVEPAGQDQIRIEVRDNGPGIAPEHLGRIFERFYRVDPARSRAEGGTGLGLSIVRHLVERHGGGVEALSEPGQGTTIRFTLPAG
jgi:two-component system, OmpR family, phosphate regulon sensor histidine kinase PhoR